MANVEYRQATCTYPGMSAPAVDSLDLVVEDGEFMVLVGPSGSGKSTALRMLAGLEMVSSGEILIGDRVVTGAPPKARDIAMVFQSYALYPHLSVADNLAFPLKQKGVSEPERSQRVLEAARLLELEPLLDRRPRQLSGGQRPRVAMGRAIGRQPQGFLKDGAALQPGCQAQGADPRGDRGAAAASRDHHRLRHPRPGRGDDPRASGRGATRRGAPAVRHSPSPLRASLQRVRGRLRRVAGDEPGPSALRRDRGPGGRGRRPPAPPRRVGGAPGRSLRGGPGAPARR